MLFRENLEKIAQIYEGIAIFSVLPGTTSHRAGVRAGDVLLVVNGRRVRRLRDYAVARAARKDTLELVVMRDGQRLTLWTEADQIGDKKSGRSALPHLTCAWRGIA